jgi:selenophosphate synthase
VDPQTSGGLLLSVDPKKSDQILKLLKTQFPKSEIIGKVIPMADKRLIWK